jgi:branched-chain amino acid transport system substrate-binding protein
VIGVIGPFNSTCAASQLAILNGGGPLATVSPSTSSTGLTRAAPGTLVGEPDIYRPTGRRNFVRVIPTDDMQGKALAELAVRLGLQHVYAFHSTDDGYTNAVVGGFEQAARSHGLDVTDSMQTPPSRAVGTRRRALAYDGVVVAASFLDSGTTEFLELVQRTGSSRMVLLGSSGLIGGSGAEQLMSQTGGAAGGMYVAFEGISNPLSQLPPAGTRFAVAFAATQANHDVTFYAPYAAQATDVMLSAIAHSDGSRPSVTRELLRTRIRDGILGTFGFNRNGDITHDLIPILRIGTAGNPDALRVTDVIPLTPTPAT